MNEDPCIIDSIADKLFPKLSLENKNLKAVKQNTRLREQKVKSEPVDDCFQNDDNEKMYSNPPSSGIKLIDEYGEFYLEDSFDECFNTLRGSNEGLKEIEALTPAVINPQRSASVSFPQLSNTNGPDLSQMLSELAAGL